LEGTVVRLAAGREVGTISAVRGTLRRRSKRDMRDLCPVGAAASLRDSPKEALIYSRFRATQGWAAKIRNVSD